MNNEILFKVKCIDIESLYLTVDKEYNVVEVDEGFYKVKNDNGELQWYYDSRFEMINKPPFKVKCTYIDNDCLTIGKEYNVVEVDEGFYQVENDSGEFWWYHNGRFEMINKPPFKVKCIGNDCANLTIGKEYDVVRADGGFYKVKSDSGRTQWYYDSRFEIVETPSQDKQEFSVGDKVVINKTSIDYVPSVDKNVKVGNVATVENILGSDVELSNPNWRNAWWFSKSDVSLVADNNPLDDKSRDYHILSHQEVIQATLDGKELEIQYTDGTWNRALPINTTLHQLTTLNFRLKPETPLEDKRKAVIKKLLTTKVAVLCKCWDDDYSNSVIVAITSIDDDYTCPYMNNCLAYKYAYAIDDNGNEITNV